MNQSFIEREFTKALNKFYCVKLYVEGNKEVDQMHVALDVKMLDLKGIRSRTKWFKLLFKVTGVYNFKTLRAVSVFTLAVSVSTR